MTMKTYRVTTHNTTCDVQGSDFDTNDGVLSIYALGGRPTAVFASSFWSNIITVPDAPADPSTQAEQAAATGD